MALAFRASSAIMANPAPDGISAASIDASSQTAGVRLFRTRSPEMSDASRPVGANNKTRSCGLFVAIGLDQLTSIADIYGDAGQHTVELGQRRAHHYAIRADLQCAHGVLVTAASFLHN